MFDKYNMVIWKKSGFEQEYKPYKDYLLSLSQVLEISKLAKKSDCVVRIEFYLDKQEYTTNKAWHWECGEKSWDWGYRWSFLTV